MGRNLKVNKAKPREDRAVALAETAVVVVMEDSPVAVAISD